MVKHLPQKALKKLQNDLLYSKKLVGYNRSTLDRRACISATPADITDNNLDKRLTIFKDQLRNDYTHRILYDTLPISVK